MCVRVCVCVCVCVCIVCRQQLLAYHNVTYVRTYVANTYVCIIMGVHIIGLLRAERGAMCAPPSCEGMPVSMAPGIGGQEGHPLAPQPTYVGVAVTPRDPYLMHQHSPV